MQHHYRTLGLWQQATDGSRAFYLATATAAASAANSCTPSIEGPVCSELRGATAIGEGKGRAGGHGAGERADCGPPSARGAAAEGKEGCCRVLPAAAPDVEMEVPREGGEGELSWASVTRRAHMAAAQLLVLSWESGVWDLLGTVAMGQLVLGTLVQLPGI